jgi:hypothetical protein
MISSTRLTIPAAFSARFPPSASWCPPLPVNPPNTKPIFSTWRTKRGGGYHPPSHFISQPHQRAICVVYRWKGRSKPNTNV